ncbi:MAG: hypothetical protein RBS80_30825 [Thermoguttaceae bacterium]|jgi:type II secretory ATPase GspE/PulE/Tfp pilus assembly ATPase PilB-like protein|nr:hypothetical protein [Thermoguttaceae bacterium]
MVGQKFVDLTTTEVLPAALSRVPESVARREHILPLTFDGERLTIVMSERPSPETLERLRFALNHPIEVVTAPHDAIRDAIEQYYGSTEVRRVAMPVESAAEQIEFVELPNDTPAAERQMLDPGSPAIVRMVQEIIGEALHLTASRVLVLPVRNRLKVAYRIQDAVYTREDAPREMHYPILVRLMAMTNLSGLIRVHIGEKELALRAVFKPSQFGLLALIEVGGETAGPEYWQSKARRLGYPFLSLDAQAVPPSVVSLLPEAVVRHRRCLPVALDGHVLTVAVSDLPEPDLLEQLRFLTNRSINVALAPAGALLAAIDRHYGPTDSETADVILWELAQSPETLHAAGEAAPVGRAKPTPSGKLAAKAVFGYLHTLYTDKTIKLFEHIRAGARLCQRNPETGELDVVFPQSHLMEQLPPDAGKYIENRIWALRESVIIRLERFLAANRPARGVAMSYALYLAGCAFREGRRAMLDLGNMQDAWLNFLYAFAVRAFPTVQSNGALLNLVAEQLDSFSAKLAHLTEDPAFVAAPEQSQPWLSRLTAQIPADESLSADSPPVTHLVDLLIAEAVHARASRLVLVPQEDRIEAAFRVQKSFYGREGLPLQLLYPILARLGSMADTSGGLRLPPGSGQRDSRIGLHAAPCGLAVSVDISPPVSAIKASRALAARHHLEFVDLADFDAPADLLGIVPRAVLRSKAVLPLRREEGGALTVALSALPSPRQLDAMRLTFNSLINVAIAQEDDLAAALYRHSHPPAAPSAISPATLELLSPGVK